MSKEFGGKPDTVSVAPRIVPIVQVNKEEVDGSVRRAVRRLLE
jgi:hypothetical protein